MTVQVEGVKAQGWFPPGSDDDISTVALRFLPQIDLSDGRVTGLLVEPLDTVRVEFLPQAGLADAFDERLLRQTCEQAAAWQRSGLMSVRLTVKLPCHQWLHSELVSVLKKLLHQTGVGGPQLGLVIPVDLLTQPGRDWTALLAQLRAFGIEIELVGFGTVGMGLDVLRQGCIDVLRLDCSLVHEVFASGPEVGLTRAMIDLAHSLRLQVVAEGVQSAAQLALLTACRCERMQGELFSAALSAVATTDLLQQQRRLPESLLPRSWGQRVLLLVDDEENILASLRRLLRRDGYSIVTAASGEQALQRLAEQGADVIVSDQRMPGMTGVEFLHRAKQLYPNSVRLVLSGYTELQSIADAINQGAIYKFLTKPWDDELLRGHIREAFEHKELADENRRLGEALLNANQELAAVNQRLQQGLDEQQVRLSQGEISMATFRAILERLPAVVLGLDSEGLIAFLNLDAEHLLGPVAELLGQAAERVLPAQLGWLLAPNGGADVARTVVLQGQRFDAVVRDIDRSGQLQARVLVMVVAGAQSVEELAT